MSHLHFLSTTSIVLAAGVAAAPGCDNTCGPGGAPETGLLASSDMVTLTYGNLIGSLNNDCPAAGAPSGVISMTIIGHQSDSSIVNSTGINLNMCVARPDLLANQAQALGVDAGVPVRVLDFTGDANSCSFAVDKTQPVTGSATSSGLCGNGSDAAGFAIELDGSLTLTRTCGTTTDSVQVTLRGRVAVGQSVILTPG